MKISVNWLKEYVDLEGISVSDLATRIGARLVEVEEVVDFGAKYKDVLVVRVVSAEQIEGTHLSVCKIDDGGKFAGEIERDDSGLVQVVCGAPNVREGLITAWVPVGATVPCTFGTDDPFVLGVKKMRGYMSNGMLAGADELALGDDHSGIVELNGIKSAVAGASLIDVLGLDDYILDIENKSLTHRPDCFGIIGFAREVAGIFGREFKTPEWLYDDDGVKCQVCDAKVEIEVENKAQCTAYRAIILGLSSNYSTLDGKKQEVSDEKSAFLDEMSVKLLKSGMRPIEKKVDWSNYLMLLSGQPLHFFDYDKMLKVGGASNVKIGVRSAKNGEKLKLLNDKTIEMTTGDIVICSGNVPVALAGVMGGKNTEIDGSTKRILVEAATFNLYNLRSTGMRYGIFSEALTRFTKGQPAELSRFVLAKTASELVDNLGMEKLSEIVEVAEELEPARVEVSAGEINEILGTAFSYEEIEKTLRNVGFGVGCACGKSGKCECEKIVVTAPYWRTDIAILEDVAEEIGRLNGFDNIELKLPERSAKQVDRDEMGDAKQKLRKILMDSGANEILTYSFVSGKLLEKAGLDVANSYRIMNSISPELQYCRQSLIPSLAEKVYLNAKAAYNKFCLFEINKISSKDMGLTTEGVPVESNRVAVMLTDRKNKNWEKGEAFYAAKRLCFEAIRGFGIDVDLVEIAEIDDGAVARSLDSRRAVMLKAGEEEIGCVGELTQDMKQKLKLPDFVAGFEMDVDVLMRLPKRAKRYGAYNNRESIDVSILVDEKMTWAEIEKKIRECFDDTDYFYDLEPLDIYSKDGGKVLSWRIVFGNYEKTLTKSDAQIIMEEIAAVVAGVGGKIV
ncbi:MAG: phenylalanine--tRNA ligase subunit beta [Candidatus Nomurabacteria bacterium]|jgi:phenylalanyl-tRNA synthetase beta chain|nr:phenylalanine--tRNA ligase subunit beta [Candidatus Nomurabacteria bacterium]